MNICLLSSVKSSTDLPSELIARSSDLGYRIVVLFLKPQNRHFWSRNSLIFYSPNTLAIAGTPLDILYRGKINKLRNSYLPSLQNTDFRFLSRVVFGLERRSFQAARFTGAQLAKGFERSVNVVRSQVIKRLTKNPFAKIPHGADSYALFHALDSDSVDAARLACELSGAVMVGPDCGDVAKAYEEAILTWLAV